MHAHGTECRTERESLEEGAVDELPVGLREVNLRQCISSIVFHKGKEKARLAVTTLFYLFSTNNYTYLLDSTILYQSFMHAMYPVFYAYIIFDISHVYQYI